MSERPKILLAPVNFANMPVSLAAGLRARGYEAAHLSYGNARRDSFGYPADRIADMGGPGGETAAQFRALGEALAEGFDIFHFWNRSLVARNDRRHFSGLDLPLIKARGRRIAYRFTGFDLRLPSRDLELNPNSPFRHGVEARFDEGLMRAYQDFLKEYVDRFIVQDPEMAQFWPDAQIAPRGLDLSAFPFVGVERTDTPLVVHAPSDPAAKGTKYVLAAVEQLKSEGLKFEFRLVQGMAHADAIALYRRADVIVDQLLIGATGVLTLEAWALGKPVVVNLRRDLFEPFYGVDDLPVANAGPDEVVDELRRVIRDFDLRRDLAERGRRLVEAHHAVDAVVDRHIAIYEDMMRRPPKQPSGDGDVRYFQKQMEMSVAADRGLGAWLTGYGRAYRRQRAALSPEQSTLAAARTAWAPLLKRDLRALKRFRSR